MSRIFSMLFFVVLWTNSYGQFNCNDTARFEINKQKVHNVIGLVPSNARVTNGWAIGWSTLVSDYCAYMTPIRINGLYTNISPFQLFVAGMGIGMGAVALFMPKTYKNINVDTASYDSIIITHKFNGLMISGIYNKAYKGNGLQIGLINKTKKMNGIQIGLWNKIGNRGLPFINMSFKKKN